MKNNTLIATAFVSAFLSTSALSYGGLVTDSSGGVVNTATGCLHYGKLSDANNKCPTNTATKKMPMKAPMAMSEMKHDAMKHDAMKHEQMMHDDMKKSEMSAPAPVVKNIISLDGVNFKTGSNQLTGASLNTLDSVAQSLKANPATKIIVAGHTDNTGDAQKNLKLSQARAEAVREHLISQGVSAKQLVARGYGDAEAIASNDTSAGRSKNRRVELRILK